MTSWGYAALIASNQGQPKMPEPAGHADSLSTEEYEGTRETSRIRTLLSQRSPVKQEISGLTPASITAVAPLTNFQLVKERAG